MNLKKILYIVSTLKKAGPTIQLSYIIKYLDKSKFEPVVLTLSPESEKDSMKSHFEDNMGVRVKTLSLSRLQGLLLAKKCVKTFIKENSVDIVHSHGIRADGLMKDIHIHRVSTLHNYPYYDYLMTYGKFKGFMMATFHLYCLKKIDEPRVVSKSISQMLKTMNNYEIDYIRNGTDVKIFQNLVKNSLREKLRFQKDTKLFISVGHLSSRKDPLVVIKAFQDTKIENSKLIFLGDGHLRQECLKVIGDHKNIQLIGRVDNVHEYLGASDYFISASLAEGLPNTVLEAMACGLPCILSSIPPHIEIHQINKGSSMLFETKDIKGLSNKIKEIMCRDYKAMSQASKEIVFDNLNAEIMSKNYQKLYEELSK